MEQAINLAKIKNSEVVLLSVIEEKHSIFDILSDNEMESEKVKQRVLSKLNEIAKKYSEKLQVGVETMV